MTDGNALRGDLPQDSPSFADLRPRFQLLRLREAFEEGWVRNSLARLRRFLSGLQAPLLEDAFAALLHDDIVLREQSGCSLTRADYLEAFPEFALIVEKACPVSDERVASDETSSAAAADTNLLFGVLAWQAGVLSEGQLLAAMQAWTFAKGKSLGEILVEQSVISESQRSKLEPMVRAHIELHQGDPAQALQSLSSVPAVAGTLRRDVSDADVQASLNHLGRTRLSESGDATSILEATIVRPRTSGDSRFRIIRPHARGGLGEVFVANDEELNCEVALKEIQDQFADDDDNRGRFVLEAEITGNLEHPGIVPVYGLGQYDNGRPYYAMRFVQGASLKDAINEFHESSNQSDSERTLELRKLLGRFIDVCQAISYAHSRGVLHRDLKPGNIMLGKYGETLVVDWGLAKLGVLPES